MIISFQRGYIFFGMPKTGSTTLHYLLGNRSDSDIVLSRVDHGKHHHCAAAVRDFKEIFALYPYSNFIKFGVIRDPVKLISSWYRIWSSDKLADPTNANHHCWLEGRTLEEFVAELESPEYNGPRRYPSAQDFYTLDDGTLGVDFLVRNEHMSEDLAALETVLPLGLAEVVDNTRLNVQSNQRGVAKKLDIGPELQDRIYRLFAADVQLYKDTPEINRKFLDSNPIAPVWFEGAEHFRQTYPDLYRANKNDKLRLRVKRSLVGIGLYKD
ncbi:MAG: sulfotransferase family 2 domain-containing protein [Gammaproteobacteria bacterium]|jgi:hypothetical protein